MEPRGTGQRPAAPAQPQTGMRPEAPAYGQAQGNGGIGGLSRRAALVAAPPSIQKLMIGESFLPAVAKYQPTIAGKITGMMLETDSSEFLSLFESEQQLRSTIGEAMRIFERIAPIFADGRFGESGAMEIG
eukprot:5202565-Lingulodinium_polyedra.AAC.1